ncbi:MAG: hypothetical protein JWM80_2120, partial [Cyanobacteria bacterium RYN_339]|nr:hypothetical protein [Cyanobacteria bacterium RYN_339]
MKKTLFTALLGLTTITGCTKLPLIGAPQAERETISKVNRVSKPTVAIQAEAGSVDPTYIDHHTTGAAARNGAIDHGTATRPLEGAADSLPDVPGQPITLELQSK